MKLGNFSRTLFAAVLAVCATVAISYGAMNLRQDTDGGASWRFSPGDNAYKVGRMAAQGVLADIATASTIHLMIPQNGILTEFHSIINNAITTADCVLTVIYNDDMSRDFTHTITQASSAAGDVDSTTGQTIQVTAGGKLRITSNGGCDTTTITHVQVFVDPGKHD